MQFSPQQVNAVAYVSLKNTRKWSTDIHNNDTAMMILEQYPEK